MCRFAGGGCVGAAAPAAKHVLRRCFGDGATARRTVPLAELVQSLPPVERLGDVLLVAPMQHAEGPGGPVPLTYRPLAKISVTVLGFFADKVVF